MEAFVGDVFSGDLEGRECCDSLEFAELLICDGGIEEREVVEILEIGKMLERSVGDRGVLEAEGLQGLDLGEASDEIFGEGAAVGKPDPVDGVAGRVPEWVSGDLAAGGEEGGKGGGIGRQGAVGTGGGWRRGDVGGRFRKGGCGGRDFFGKVDGLGGGGGGRGRGDAGEGGGNGGVFGKGGGGRRRVVN